MLLLESILTIGLMAMLLVGGATLLNNFINTSNKISISGKTEDVRNYIRAFLDCEETLKNQITACQSGDFIELKQKDTQPFIAKWPQHTIVNDDFTFEVKCRAIDDYFAIDIRYARVRDGNEPLIYLKDPVTKQDSTFKDLFDGIPYYCRQSTPGPCYAHALVGSWDMMGLPVGGECWYRLPANRNCDWWCCITPTCPGPYRPATNTYAGADGADTDCAAVIDAFGVEAARLGMPWNVTFNGTMPGFGAIGCITDSTNTSGYRGTGASTNSSASNASYKRFCACGY